MKLFCLVVLFFFTQVWPARAAEPVASVDEYLNGLVQISRAQCTDRGGLARQYQAQGKLLEAYAAEQGEKMLCECTPARAKALQARLPARERAARIAQSVFLKKYMPEIDNPCAGELMRSSYAGACAERYAKEMPDSAKFCACMVNVTRRLSDTQAAQLGGESADYAQLAAGAGKRGDAVPEPPPLLKSYLEAQAMCTRP